MMDGRQSNGRKTNMKYLFENTFRTITAKPWEVPGLSKTRPNRLKAPCDVSLVTDVAFVAPIGFVRQQIDYHAVTSVFKMAEAPELGEARVVEYHEFTMQSVSVLVVMPRDQIKGLPSIEDKLLHAKVPDIYERAKDKRVTLVMPAKVHKILETAKMANRPTALKRLQKHVQMDAKEDHSCPKEPKFVLDGPFVVVIYDQVSKRILVMKWVYDVVKLNNELKDTLTKYVKLDEKLLKQAIKAKNSEGPLDVDYSSGAASGGQQVVEATKLLVPSANLVGNNKPAVGNKQPGQPRVTIVEQPQRSVPPPPAPAKVEPTKVALPKVDLPKIDLMPKTEQPKMEQAPSKMKVEPSSKIEPPKVEPPPPMKVEPAALIEPGKAVEASNVTENNKAAMENKETNNKPPGEVRVTEKIQVVIPKITPGRLNNAEKVPVSELVKQFEPRMKKRAKFLEDLHDTVRPIMF